MALLPSRSPLPRPRRKAYRDSRHSLIKAKRKTSRPKKKRNLASDTTEIAQLKPRCRPPSKTNDPPKMAKAPSQPISGSSTKGNTPAKTISIPQKPPVKCTIWPIGDNQVKMAGVVAERDKKRDNGELRSLRAFVWWYQVPQ